MHKIKLILLLILPLSVLGQDLGIIDTKTTKNPAINGTHRISTDGKNLFFRNFFGLSRKIANTDSAVFTNGIKVNSGVNNVEIDQTQIMFRRTNGTTMTLGNYRAYSHLFFTNASFSGLTQAMSINNYGQVNIGNQVLDGIVSPTVKFQVGATGEARQRIISQASNATIELNGATGGNISNTTGNLNYTSAGNHVFNSKVILPDSTRIGNISSTELTYLDGVTSPIQTQLNNKAPITSPTFITDATTPRLKITGAGDVGKGSDLVMGGNSNDLTMHGTGKVILGTGGFQRLVVTNAGNVGVGTTAPVAKFEVSGLAGFRYNDGKQADGKYLRSNSTGVAAWDSVKVSEVFGLNTTYLPINNPTATGTLTAPTIANSLGATFATSSGNIGIGTTAPVAKLTVVGSDNAISMDAGVGGNPYLDFHQNGVQKGYLQYVNSGAYMRLVDAGVVGLVQKNGNVGIGTISPAAKLNIEGTGYTSALIRTSTTTAGGLLTLSNTTRSYSLGARGDYSAGQFNIVDETAGLARFSIFSTGRVGIGTTTDAGYLTDINGTLRTVNDAYFATTSGNVGIGTTSPLTKFHAKRTGLNGAGLATVSIIATDGKTIGDGIGLDFFGHDSGDNEQGYGSFRYRITNATVGSEASELSITTWNAGANTERIKVSSTGNVGIGTTTPNASSILDITSTTKGILFPRMTTGEINLIASPADGLTVYNTTLKAICFYDSSAAVWKKVSHSNM